ncbi:hypothetical protein HNQ07_000532 [Deinococcus metalli]|uniref:Lipoprotein n=1 Tax=Deinococcus metalli TaxID=1141878 RepID=A0A7W8KC99_9DEIO|nr:hypothetical protein [Deinococcus metalli]MBB5375088.1 hypothetical protein [Deinococcus metalli]GHF31622.1 hypothetical protein GCM10017781_05100 [Deinococcus metalli]
MTRLAPALAAVALSAALAGCTTTTPPTVPTLTLQGTATGVSFPDSVVYLASGDETNLDYAGTLSAPDTFRLTATTAPSAATAFDLLTVPSGCTVSGPAQAHPRVHFYDRLVVHSPQGDPLGSIREVIKSGNTLSFSRVARVYSDRAAVVKATISCGPAAQVNFDLTVVKGWNALEYAVGSNSVTMKTLGKVTTAFEAEQNLPYLSVVFAPSTLTFTSNTTFQVNATFYQEGGIGGEYNLELDTPGLSVEPARVSVPGLAVLGTRPGAALGRLGLGAQSLTTTLTFTYTGTQSGKRPFVMTLSDDYGQQAGRGDGVLDVQRP